MDFSEGEEEGDAEGLATLTGDCMCITLKQPFASAVAEDIKKTENRKWALKLPADGTGRWIFVHAGAEPAGSELAHHVEALQKMHPEFTSQVQSLFHSLPIPSMGLPQVQSLVHSLPNMGLPHVQPLIHSLPNTTRSTTHTT